MVFQTNQILAISLFFHLMATTIWIGGLVITSILVWPEAQRTLQQTPTLFSLLGRIRKRVTPLSNFSLAVLIVTGLTQMSLDSNYEGFLNFANTWSVVMVVKHLVIGAMIVVGIILQYAVFPALERMSLLVERGKSQAEGDLITLRQREIRLTWINVFLGIIVLALSAVAGSL
jgi:uncharacterized membrane protein